MSKRRVRKSTASGHSTTTRGARADFSSLPAELHKECLKYLSQPELLRVGSLSKHWRLLAMEEPRFYLAARLEDLSETEVEVFIQHLDDAVGRKMPVGITLDLEGPPIATCASFDDESDVLAQQVSPAIERSMSYVRKLSVVLGSPLPPATLDFLQACAPDLREFVLRIHMNMDPDLFGGLKYFRGLREEAHKEHVANLEVVLEGLFDGAAKKLTRVHLGGIVLEALRQDPVSVFAAVTHVEASNVATFPEFGLGEHFPHARHLVLELNESCLDDYEAYACPAFLSAGLATLDVWTTATVLRAFLQHVDLRAVPDLRIAFDGHFSIKDGGRDARDGAWEGCLADRGAQRTMSIFSTSWNNDGKPADLRISVSDASDAGAVVTFYAEDSICEPELYADAPYGPLASLACIGDNVTTISVEHAHLKAIFSITTATLPALRSLHIALRVGKPLRTAFWKSGRYEKCPLECPALSELEISCGSDVAISSKELASFARAIGLSDAHRPRLILRGVTIEGEPLHSSYFCDADA